MNLVARRTALLLVGVLACGIAMSTAGEARAQQAAITGTVSGQQIQKVGFRAMIQKQAIMYNLAGYARNNPDGTVSISLQGDKDRVDRTLDAIRKGSKRSSSNNTVSAANAALDPNLTTFAVFGWTSTSRNITNPYHLVFQLRPADDEISRKQAEEIWNAIAESTLKGNDLEKFKTRIGGED
jgi:acylphosphatase